MAKKYDYSHGSSTRMGLMICACCGKEILNEEFRYRMYYSPDGDSDKDRYITHHRKCTEDDPNWALNDAGVEKVSPFQLKQWLDDEKYEPDVQGAVRCKCGGKLARRYREAYSTDSSFGYVGCTRCDLAFIDSEEIDDVVIKRWNMFNS